MKCNFEHNKDMDACIVRVSGVHKRPDDSMELQKMVRDYKAENGCSKYLLDMRDATIKGDNISSYHAITAALDQGMKPYEYRFALVYSGDLSEHKFIELVAINRGYSLQVFDDYERAKHWLANGLQDN